MKINIAREKIESAIERLPETIEPDYTITGTGYKGSGTAEIIGMHDHTSCEDINQAISDSIDSLNDALEILEETN